MENATKWVFVWGISYFYQTSYVSNISEEEKKAKSMFI